MSLKLVDTANLLSNLSSTTFIDVCGGPGAFTQLVLRLVCLLLLLPRTYVISSSSRPINKIGK